VKRRESILGRQNLIALPLEFIRAYLQEAAIAVYQQNAPLKLGIAMHTAIKILTLKEARISGDSLAKNPLTTN
jgi:hypothetical protein